MNRNTKYKAIIKDMINEYQNEPNPSYSRLYFIIAQYLDEETAENIEKRFKIAKSKEDN